MNKSKQTLRLPIRATVVVAILTVWTCGFPRQRRRRRMMRMRMHGSVIEQQSVSVRQTATASSKLRA